MSVDTDSPVATVPPSLRAAHKELTRSRIRDAARELFYEQGYYATTMDQIAVAAGVRRSTLYFHFKDKGEIVHQIAQEYAPKARAINSRLPGPAPSKAEIERWMGDVAEFLRVERAPTVLFRDITGAPVEATDAMRSLADDLIETMAMSHPAFRAAVEPGEGQAVARARAELVMRELTRVCLRISREGSQPELEGMRAVCRDLIYNFTRGEPNLLA